MLSCALLSQHWILRALIDLLTAAQYQETLVCSFHIIWASLSTSLLDPTQIEVTTRKGQVKCTATTMALCIRAWMCPLPGCRSQMCPWSWPQLTTRCTSSAGSTGRPDGSPRDSRSCWSVCWTSRTLPSSSQRWCLWWWLSCGRCCGSSYVSGRNLML